MNHHTTAKQAEIEHLRIAQAYYRARDKARAAADPHRAEYQAAQRRRRDAQRRMPPPDGHDSSYYNRHD